MIKIYRRTIKDKSLQEIDTIETGSWVHIDNPSEMEINTLAELTKINKEILVDSVDQNELPRIEKENDTLIIFTRVPMSQEAELNTTPLTIIITSANIFTIILQENRVTQAFLDKEVDFYTTQKAKFLIKIFSVTVHRFNRHINAMNKRVATKRGKLRYLRTDDIVNLVETEEDLNDFISSLAPNINVYERILHGKFIKLHESDQDSVEDMLIDARQVLDLCRTNVIRINNIRTAYTSIVSNNLNKTMKFLAAITVMMTVPTIIASIYGMNVALPFAENPLIFIYILVFIIVSCLSILAMFFWRRWL